VKRKPVAESTMLEVETLPIRATCKACSCASEVQNYGAFCTDFASEEVELIQGMELDVKEIEIE
jgi:Zn finger protein HypA/HybF involved in hydrogenase expression